MALPVSPAKTPVSPKVVLAGVGALLLPILLAGLAALVNHVLANPSLLDSIPSWLVVPILAMLSSAGAVIAGYRQRDPIREEGAEVLASRGVLTTGTETGPGGARSL